MSGAARVKDPIEHSQAYLGFIAGAIIGAAAGVAITVFSRGKATGVGLGIYAATASFGEWLGSFPIFCHVTGSIQEKSGSPNVFINGLPAAVATDSGKQLPSQVTCDSHVGPQFVAEGSATVFINGRPAARIGDHTTCGAKISGGSNNVFIGGGTVSTVDIDGEVPEWAHLSVAVSGLASCILLRIPITNIVLGAKLGAIAGTAGRWLGGRLAGEGSNTQHLLEGTFGLLGAAWGGASAEQQASAFARFKNVLAGWETQKPTDIVVEEANKPNREKLSGPSENWQTYRAKERDAIKKGPLRTKIRNFQERINKIREKMPNNELKKRSNMAIADVHIKGIKSEFKAHSKIHDAFDKGANLDDFSYTKEENDRLFSRYEPVASAPGRTPYDRFNDTEAKILEGIASQISESTHGNIDLYTELDACQSCTNIIYEFMEKFPNIKLNVFSRSMGD